MEVYSSVIYLHFVRRFWNHVFTWASVIFRPLAKAALSADARYFCLWNRFSNSATWGEEADEEGYRFKNILAAS